jgi:hypothetical protein
MTEPAVNTTTTVSADHNLRSFIQHKTWDSRSLEARKREKALTDLFVASDISTQLVKNQEFKKLCSTLDPKFKLPGI